MKLLAATALLAGCAAAPHLRVLHAAGPVDAHVGVLPALPTTTTSTTATTTVAVRASGAARSVPAPAPAGSWQTLVASYPWPVAVADRVVMCESGGNPNAHNRSGANGLFQVMGGSYDPAANVAEAFSMWRTRGWEPWAASRSCWS